MCKITKFLSKIESFFVLLQTPKNRCILMKRLKIYMLMTFAVAIWGISLVLTKEVFASDPHFTAPIIIFCRLLFSIVFFVPVMLLARRLEPIRKGDLKYFLLLAFLEPFLYFMCENSGLRYVSSGVASIIIASIPVFIPFGMFMVYHEKLKIIHVAGVVLSLIGVYLMILGEDGGYTFEFKGLALLGAAVAVAVVNTLTLVKVVDRYRALTITMYQNLIGLAYFLPVILFSQLDNFQAITFSPKILLLLGTLGIGCSTLAYVCFNYSIRKIGATPTLVFNNATPVFTLFFACILGQESLTWGKMAGMAVAVLGVTVVQLKK